MIPFVVFTCIFAIILLVGLFWIVHVIEFAALDGFGINDVLGILIGLLICTIGVIGIVESFGFL